MCACMCVCVCVPSCVCPVVCVSRPVCVPSCACNLPFPAISPAWVVQAARAAEEAKTHF